MAKVKQFAVIGLGRFGSSVATTLAKAGKEVLAIDADEERVQKFVDIVTHVVKADTTDENTLKELGIRNFDIVIVAIGADIQASILTTLLLKELGVKHIVAKADNLYHGKMLQKIGADRVVYPERDMGIRIAHNLIATNVIDYIDLSPNLGIVEIEVPKSLVGQTLLNSKIRTRFGVTLVAIKRGSDMIVSPVPEEKFLTGDLLIVIGGNQNILEFEELE